MSRIFTILLLIAATAVPGCQGSRWARSDPRYANKYQHHSDNPLKMAKQAVDARQVDGRSGIYAGFANRRDPNASGLQVGGFRYLPGFEGMLETRAGAALLLAETDSESDCSGGLDLGFRLQTPTRLAPFAGGGIYAGYVPDLNHLLNSPFDEDSGFPDSTTYSDDEPEYELVGAVYPEVGLHYWITPRWRLTASASHYVTSINQESNFSLYGLQLAWLDIPRGWSEPYQFNAREAERVEQAERGKMIAEELETGPSEPLAPGEIQRLPPPENPQPGDLTAGGIRPLAGEN